MSLGSNLKASTDFIEVLSVGTALISTVLLVSPVQGVGYIGIGSGIGAFTASVLCKSVIFSRKQHHSSTRSLMRPSSTIGFKFIVNPYKKEEHKKH